MRGSTSSSSAAGQSKGPTKSKEQRQGHPLSCPFCPLTSPTPSDRVAHLKNDHGQSLIYNCTLCNTLLIGTSEYEAHQTTVHSPKIKCPQCPQLKFSIEQDYLLHSMTVHELLLENSIYFACEHCTTINPPLFKTKEELFAHKILQHNNSNGTNASSYLSNTTIGYTTTGGLFLDTNSTRTGTTPLIADSVAGPTVSPSKIMTKSNSFECQKCRRGFHLRGSLSLHNCCPIKTKINYKQLLGESRDNVSFVLSA